MITVKAITTYKRKQKKFLRSVKERTKIDKIRNDTNKQELGIFTVNEKITEHKNNWKEHLVNKRQSNTETSTDYKPRERRVYEDPGKDESNI